MAERRPEGDDGHDEHGDDTPKGAIAVTGFLTFVILMSWFGMYALNLARS